MFGIGPTELIVILVVALLLLGPKRLPEIARSLGKGFAEFKRASNELRSHIDVSLDDKPTPPPPPAQANPTPTGRSWQTNSSTPAAGDEKPKPAVEKENRLKENLSIWDTPQDSAETPAKVAEPDAADPEQVETSEEAGDGSRAS